MDLDLNLLKVFEAIILEKNLTRAASKLSLSQPAVSHSLAKLRDYFNDPLFVREGNHMVPTRKAESIYHDLKRSLKILHNLAADKGLQDPTQSARTMVLGISNYTSQSILPPLMTRLLDQAPFLKIRTRHLPLSQKVRMLKEGDVDLVIGSPMNVKSSLKQQFLFSDDEVCIASKETFIKEGSITPKNIGNYSLVKYHVSDREQQEIYQEIDTKTICLNAPLITDQELLIPEIVAETNCIGIVGKKIALKYKKQFALNILPIKGIKTQFSIHQYWHMRNDTDPIHSWLRKVIKDIGMEMENPSDCM